MVTRVPPGGSCGLPCFGEACTLKQECQGEDGLLRDHPVPECLQLGVAGQAGDIGHPAVR